MKDTSFQSKRYSALVLLNFVMVSCITIEPEGDGLNGGDGGNTVVGTIGGNPSIPDTGDHAGSAGGTGGVPNEVQSIAGASGDPTGGTGGSPSGGTGGDIGVAGTGGNSVGGAGGEPSFGGMAGDSAIGGEGGTTASGGMPSGGASGSDAGGTAGEGGSDQGSGGSGGEQGNEDCTVGCTKLSILDGGVGDKFGFSVALSGDTALVGTWGNDAAGADAGAAYIFVRSGGSWILQQELLPDDAVAGNWFGYAVALKGDTALVGALQHDINGTGVAYIFVRVGTAWIQQQKLLPSDGVANDRFGVSVALNGDTALVGAWGNDTNGTDAGAAYVFTRISDTWMEQQKLLPSDGSELDYFGGSVALSGHTALIGADWDDDNGSNSGSAYVFTRVDNTWMEQQKLLPDGGRENDGFGFAVVLDGDTALIGAPGYDFYLGYDDVYAIDTGAAYVFERAGGSWTEQQPLLLELEYGPRGGPFTSSPRNGTQFGWPLALNDSTALIGSIPYFVNDPDDDLPDDLALPATGLAYVHTRINGSWIRQPSSLYFMWDSYSSLALSGNTALVGAAGTGQSHQIMNGNRGLSGGSCRPS